MQRSALPNSASERRIREWVSALPRPLPRRQKPGIGHQFLPIESAKVERLPVEAIGIEIKTVLLQNENFLAYAQYFIKQLARQFMKMIFFPFNRHGRV